MINPMKLMKIKNAWSRFAANHPKFPLFLNAIVKKGIQEETIFEFKVTYPDGQQLVTNMRLRSGFWFIFSPALPEYPELHKAPPHVPPAQICLSAVPSAHPLHP